MSHPAPAKQAPGKAIGADGRPPVLANKTHDTEAVG